jgi:RimJ/RimL family protein N-acetyltransferase
MFARTERLLLRPGWAEDAPALAEAIGDEAVVRNLSRVPHPYSAADARAFIESPHDPLLPRFLIFSRTRAAPRLVGGCGITRDAESGALELGYWIARPYWGLGFATEAARAVMRIARATGLKGVMSSHFVDNPASGNVLRKIGFRPVGRIVERYSSGRKALVPAALFVQGEAEDGPRGDASLELYGDAMPIAA